ncbi:MAG: galactose/glucose ABC transporter substrate-binding protein MglB [Fusobacteriaceae bacterium]|jgi:methyl-galactoside transport system substrate-binding protein|nr:galactose/glucose ABC transporter substrate-binding protein MglB [Fusobacteriaceae bacterium]
MKKINYLLGAIVFLGLATVGSKTVEAAPKYKIGFTAYKYDDNFIALVRKVVEGEAAKEKDKFELQANDSQNSQQTQNDQIDVMLSKGVNALAINLVDNGAAKTVLDKISKEKIPVVFYNRKPSDEAMASYDKVYYVGTDPNAQGIAQGELILKYWKAHPEADLNKDGKIQYVLLKGEPGHPDAEARTKYAPETIKKGGVDVVELHQDTAMWDTAQAKDKTDAWLSGPNGDKIEVIICNNDAMAFGAIESAKALGKKLPIFGVDALPEALVKIEAGEMVGTVLNDAKGQGFATWKLAANLAEGKSPTDGTDIQLDGKEVLVPSVGIDKDNVKEYK